MTIHSEIATIETLENFANYILKEKLKSFCAIQIEKFDAIGKGLFPQYDQLPYEGKMEMSIPLQTIFLESIANNRFSEQIDLDLQRYESELKQNEFSDFDFDINSMDIILEARTYSLMQILDELALGELIPLKIEMEIKHLNDIQNKKILNFLARTKDLAFRKYRNKVEEMHKAIRYAQTIQSNMMRIENEIEQSGINGFVLNMPRDFVSGDFYHFQKVDNGKFLVVSDCTGHGIPAALLTVLGLNLFQIAIQYRRSDDPGEILHLIDLQFKQQFQYSMDSKESMDVALFFIPNKGQTVHYCSANASVFHQTKEATNILSKERRSLGSSVFSEPFETMSFEYTTGDRLYLQSDGYQDQFGGPKGKSLKRKGYINLLERMRDIPIKEVKTHMESFIGEWKGNEDQVDDICVMGIEF